MLLQSNHLPVIACEMVRITIVGRGDASVEECDEGVNADAVKRNLIDAYGPGLLKRGNRMVVSETLSGDYEFHVKGKIFSLHCLFLLILSASFPVTNTIQ